MKTNKLIKRFLILTITCGFIFSLTACKTKKEKVYNNEEDPLVLTTQPLDNVFNPFFSTSASDGTVVGMTQMGMIGNDKDGNPICGDSEPVIVKKYYVTNNGGTLGDDLQTTYYFVLKNNVRFSNGSYLTIKDVLFNFYVYLDPQYTGSSTIYSTDIVGLKEYRTQELSETEQENFFKKFQIVADSRIEALIDVSDEILEGNSQFTANEFKDELSNYTSNNNYKYVVSDFEKACELFKKELNEDYSNAVDAWYDLKFYDDDKNEYANLIQSDAQMFLYNEGYISWSKKDAKMTSSLVTNYNECKNWTKEQCIEKVYNNKIPNSIGEIVQFWATSSKLNEFICNTEMENYFKEKGKKVDSIKGIDFANRTEAVVINGDKYDVPVYDENTKAPKDGSYEVLSITINDVDPKAIWNFALGIAPMYYYSNAEQIAKFDYVSNFGVEFGSRSFFNDVVNSPDKVGLPVGAGPYACSKVSGGIENVKSNEFFQNNIVYYERNPYYLMGPAKIKKLRLQVTNQNSMINAIMNNEVDFVEPNATVETKQKLDAANIKNKSITTNGYGYIGINAGKVPSVNVRRAIMHSINTMLCIEYYRSEANPIYRPMSMASWAYPKTATAYYPYIGGDIPTDLDKVFPYYKEYIEELRASGELALTEKKLSTAQQKEYIARLIEEAGYNKNSSGTYQKGNDKLVYKFTIAGETSDHPAWNALFSAGKFLETCGFEIETTTDSNALKKLSNGDLTVWAAAWGSSIDPDMYQVYHKDSKATSVLNWGYKQILADASGNKYGYEQGIINELSDIIDAARKIDTNEDMNEDAVRKERARKYSQALDLVMELAVELPTYQRNDLFGYNNNKIDEGTMNQNTSCYSGLLDRLDQVSLVLER